jgi:protein SCO1/2
MDRPEMASRTPRAARLVALTLVTIAACAPRSELDRVAGRMTAIQSAAPFTVPSYTLTDQTGADVDLQELIGGRFALLFFGYTHCPDVCPLSMAAANAAVQQLDPDERDRVEIVFVTVDPRRDSPERIAEWLSALRMRATGLRASKVEVEGLLSAMGFAIAPSTSVQALPPSDDGTENYLVPHPASLFLVTPDGLGRFQYPFERATPTQIAEDLRMLMELDW